MIRRIIRNFFALLIAPLLLLRRWRASPKGGWVRLSITGRLSEVTLPRRLRLRWRLSSRQKAAVSLSRVSALADRLIADPRPHGLWLELEPIEQGFAMASALADVLARIKAAGKAVHVHLPKGGGLRDYLVASAGSTISMPPYASLNLIGIGAKQLYFKDALAQVGVEADVDQRYEYKSAGEPFARASMSEKAREQQTRLLAAVESEVNARISGWRKAATSEVLGRGPYRASEALTLGLIDHQAHNDAVAALLGERLDTGARRYLDRRSVQVWRSLRRKRVVAVVRVAGNIVEESGVPGQAASEDVVEAAEDAMDMRSVAAVVLLVDSRGGSAFASAEMHRALVRLGEKKPVVAYFSDYAASGGYYVATHAKEIWANPLTVTGSIGVISMRPMIDGLLERLRIGKDGVTRGAHAGLLDVTGRWTEEERAAVRRQTDATYDEFTTLVAEGRKLADVDAVARGRVFLGSEAAKNGLVDKLGTLTDAVTRARELAGGRTEAVPVLLGEPRYGWQSLLGSAWRGAGSSLLQFFMRGPLAYEPFELLG